MGKRVLVVGSGGREHALAWALSRSQQVESVFVAPGNGGTVWDGNSDVAGLHPKAPSSNVNIGASDFPALIEFAKKNAIDLTIIGPEVPLVEGIVDAFQAEGLVVFGPSRAAAQLEGSKAFSKDFMHENNIPTAEYGIWGDYDLALMFLPSFDRPVVVKADGLAAGKGVLVCDSVDEAKMALKQIMLDHDFGAAGDQVVIEERLKGREISVLAFSDGKTVAPMIVSRDHKRALDGDQGLNTGGMGAFAPTTDVSQNYIDKVCRDVLQPVIDGMNRRGTPYVGVLYAGLMIDGDDMRVLEFNCRFGDPETQVILPLLDTDLYEIMTACIAGHLSEIEIKWKSESCATVVLASPGYPQGYPKGLPISGLDAVDDENVIVFHAGTAQKDGRLVTSGGRVLAVTAIGADLDRALFRVYASVDKIHFDNMHYRRDIGRTT